MRILLSTTIKKKQQFDQLHYTQPELGEAISLNGKLVSCSYRYL